MQYKCTMMYKKFNIYMFFYRFLSYYPTHWSLVLRNSFKLRSNCFMELLIYDKIMSLIDETRYKF